MFKSLDVVALFWLKWAFSLISRKNSWMSKFNLFLLYFFSVGTKFKFLFKGLYVALENEYLDKFVTFRKGSYLYRIASLIARLILIVLPWFVERRLRLLWILHSCVLGLLLQRPPVRFSNCQFYFFIFIQCCWIMVIFSFSLGLF